MSHDVTVYILDPDPDLYLSIRIRIRIFWLLLGFEVEVGVLFVHCFKIIALSSGILQLTQMSNKVHGNSHTFQPNIVSMIFSHFPGTHITYLEVQCTAIWPGLETATIKMRKYIGTSVLSPPVPYTC